LPSSPRWRPTSRPIQGWKTIVVTSVKRCSPLRAVSRSISVYTQVSRGQGSLVCLGVGFLISISLISLSLDKGFLNAFWKKKRCFVSYLCLKKCCQLCVCVCVCVCFCVFLGMGVGCGWELGGVS
jgi:hypothetical protein